VRGTEWKPRHFGAWRSIARAKGSKPNPLLDNTHPANDPRSRPGSLSALRRPPVFLGRDLLSLLSGALALIRPCPMLGCQLRKGGSRINVADRFSDPRQNLRLSAVVGRTVHVDPGNFPCRKGEKRAAVGGIGGGMGSRALLKRVPRGWVPLRNA
jgi:hypothetical protein